MSISNNPEFLETRPVGRLLLQFSVPAITATLVSATYSLIARIFVGQRFGMLGITAVTVSFPVMLIMLAFAMMVGTGATTLISIYLGEKNNDKAERILGQALFMYFVVTTLFVIGGHLWLEDLLRLFGASPEVLPYARSYMTVIIWGSFFQQISFGVNNFIRAEGHPNVAMISMLISAFVNVILDWFFLFYLETGIWGAGLANVIAMVVTSVWVCWLYLTGRTVLRWRLRYMWFDYGLIRKICIFGAVPLSMQACSVLIQGLQNYLLGYYGDLYGQGIALVGIRGGDLAIGIAGTLFAIVMMMVMPLLGLSQGMQPIVGYNVGAVRPDRVHRALTISLNTGVLFGIAFWIVLVFCPHWFLYLFIRADDPNYQATMTMGIFATRVMLFATPLVAINIISSGYFQAHGRPMLSLLLTSLRQILFLIPLLCFFPWFFTRYGFLQGLDGCWLAYPVSDSLAFLITWWALHREFLLKKKMIEKHRVHLD